MTNPVHPERQASFAKGLAWVVRLAAAGLIAAPTVMALIALTGMRNQYADLIAQFTAPALFATLGLAAVFLLARRRRWAAATLAPAALLLIAVSPQWFPAASRPEAGASTIRIYSANLWVRNRDLEAIAASIRQANADVVMLIELGDATAPHLDALVGAYPYRIASPRIDRPNGAVRSVIVSRYPLTALPRPAGVEAVGARAATPLGPLNIISIHLTRPWPFEESWGQISQTMALDEMVQGLSGPVVVAGDFNSVSTARIGKQVQRDIGLRPAPGFPGTWPGGLPSALGITIDQVYASPDLAFVSRRLGRPTGSDHRPVVTEITRAAD
jgi:endonuclease/exonuclease/phosphatase (EEP) superfamily protein YafD